MGNRRGQRCQLNVFVPSLRAKLAPCWGQTMKQSFASAARLRGGGPILTNGSMTVFWLGSPPPRIVIGTKQRRFSPDVPKLCVAELDIL